ncbi:hypothetical protein KBD49_12195, partial [Myxococcota bacterium]|nr:hypothetical protein [Myxococcota bacterium]
MRSARGVPGLARLPGFAPFLAFVALLAGAAGAAPLRDKPVRVVQPDGTEWWILVSGDEYRQRLHDARGFTVVRDPAGWWVYADEVGGRLVPTVVALGQGDPERIGLPREALDRAETIVPWLAAVPRPGGTPPTGPAPAPAPRNPAPRTGTMNSLVVFVRFSDQAEFGQPIGTYDAPLNGSGVSMRSYFREVSYQQL